VTVVQRCYNRHWSNACYFFLLAVFWVNADAATDLTTAGVAGLPSNLPALEATDLLVDSFPLFGTYFLLFGLRDDRAHVGTTQKLEMIQHVVVFGDQAHNMRSFG